MESTGSRRSSLRWVAALIKKFWDVSWDVWQQRNHILHAVGAGDHLDILSRIHERVTYHHRRTGRGLPKRHQFLFRFSLPFLLKRTVRYKIAWLQTVAGARLRHRRKRKNFKESSDPDLSLVKSVVEGRLLKQLRALDSRPPFRTSSKKIYSPLLKINREEDEDGDNPDAEILFDPSFLPIYK